MIKSGIWIVAALVLAMFAGPLAFLGAHFSDSDPLDVYFAFDAGRAPLTAPVLSAYGAKGLGPQRSAFGTLIEAPAGSRRRLLQAGYVLVPARAVAAICGVDANKNALARMN